MPGQRPLLAMGFIGSLGITFNALACILPKGEGNSWPLIIYIFYLLLPATMTISKRVMKETASGLDDGSAARMRDYSLFFAAGIMVSTMALPIILARSPAEKPVIAPVSCFLVEIGNLLCYATIALFYMYNKPSRGL